MLVFRKKNILEKLVGPEIETLKAMSRQKMEKW